MRNVAAVSSDEPKVLILCTLECSGSAKQQLFLTAAQSKQSTYISLKSCNWNLLVFTEYICLTSVEEIQFLLQVITVFHLSNL